VDLGITCQPLIAAGYYSCGQIRVNPHLRNSAGAFVEGSLPLKCLLFAAN